MSFQIGDRVRYLDGNCSDCGNITRPCGVGGWWVKWDSNGQELWFSENDPLFTKFNQSTESAESTEGILEEMKFLRQEISELKHMVVILLAR